MTLTQKETMLLEDLKSQEQLCVDKYTKYSSEACDGQLRNLFSQLGQAERTHLDTINQIMSGTMPGMSSGGQSQQKPQFTQTYTESCNDKNKQNDSYLCSDALANEKHVSSVYDVSIFEFANPQLRNILNHIQKEEQGHGEMIYEYMAANGMYS